MSNGVRIVDADYAAEKAGVSASLAESLKQEKPHVEPVLDPKDRRAVQGGNSDKADSESSGPFTSVEAQPKWLANDRKVLRFNGYFSEEVHSSSHESSRLRKVVLYYYLDDDSVLVVEPREDNSGMPQGVLVKRHRIPVREGAKEFVSPNDLRVGGALSIYGRELHLVDADAFTRSYVKAKYGVELSAAEEYPLDQHAQRLQASFRSHFNILMSPQKNFVEATLGRAMGIRIEATQQFLANDRKVLRFYCQWEEPSTSSDAGAGEKRQYIMHYFLADDTVEIKEVSKPNSGRDPYPALLRRSKLPKKYAQSVANVATIGLQAHEDPDHEHYAARDLRIGSKINVFGRELLLWACDQFTQKYCISQLGFTPEDFPVIDVSERKDAAVKMEVPPYTGYGTEEDSLGSFTHLVPKVPKKDVKKIMEHDHNNLRFSATFANPSKLDALRAFIITYYVSDDTISVFEKAERNSGFIAGKFLERSKIKDSITHKPLGAADLFIGSTVHINNYAFTLQGADEFSLKFMESNPSSFPQSDVFAVYSDISSRFNADELAAAFRAEDEGKSGHLTKSQLRAAVLKHATAQGAQPLGEQQLLTLYRALGDKSKDAIAYEQILANAWTIASS